MSVTLRQIAEKAAVSVATVSRVLNNAPDARASEQVRRRILQIAEQLGYQPNPHARALTRGKASLITLVVQHTEYHISNVKSWKLQKVLSELGREVVTTDVDSLPGAQRTLQMLLANAPEAVVFLHTQWSSERLATLCEGLHAEGIYSLIVDYENPLPADIPADAVLIDRAYGAYLAVSHLIAMGHRHIALLADKAARGRVEGYQRALQEHHITEQFVAHFRAPAPVSSSTEYVVQRLFSNNPHLTALFCNSDLVALLAMSVLQRMGLRVPHDVAVVGFDNDPWTPYLPVPLTTVAQPVDEMCQQAADLLASRLDGTDMKWQRLIVKPSLVVRQSSQQPQYVPTKGGDNAGQVDIAVVP